MIVAISGLTIEDKPWWRLRPRCGAAGAGKDALAQRLVDKYDFVTLAFADPIKRMLMDVCAFTHTQMFGPSQERNRIDPRYGKTPREALQTLGDQWGRGYCKDLWAKYAIRNAWSITACQYKYSSEKGIDQSQSGPENVVITDVRYLNEFQALKNSNIKIIRCKRNVPKLGVVPNHPSEVGLLHLPDSEFDYVIENNGTIQDMWDKLDNIFSRNAHNLACMHGSNVCRS
jgi:hypothetical protein